MLAAVAALSAARAAQGSVVERPGSCGPRADALPATLTEVEAERAVQCLLNRRRARMEAQPLSLNPMLSAAAKAHSAYMQEHGCFEHVCPSEAPVEVRLATAGYIGDALRLWRYGEAIAWATGDGGRRGRSCAG